MIHHFPATINPTSQKIPKIFDFFRINRSENRYCNCRRFRIRKDSDLQKLKLAPFTLVIKFVILFNDYDRDSD